MSRPGPRGAFRVEFRARGMHPFRTAPDFYDAAATQQLAVGSALLLLAGVAVFISVHMIRRAFCQPVSREGAKISPTLRLRKYEIGARLYHWANAFLLALLAVSGIALLRPGAVPAAPWLVVHEFSAALFVAGLVLHIIVAPSRGSASTMWFQKRDWTDLKLTIRNFLGTASEYPAFGKYDPWQKLYHAFLTLASLAVIFSGAYLTLSAQAWETFSHDWMRKMRLVHDTAAFPLMAIVVGHIYFGVIRVNWPQLVSMVTGHIRGTAFNRYHDAARWNPPRSVENEREDLPLRSNATEALDRTAPN
jgi:Ni/Fe-hydrogenase 1 B-type cytochrome subunit